MRWTSRSARAIVHGLLGPNGAGKTTLLSVLFGLVLPDEGTLRLFGRTRAEAGPQLARRRGRVRRDARASTRISAAGGTWRCWPGWTAATPHGLIDEALERVGLAVGRPQEGARLLARHAAAAGPGRRHAAPPAAADPGRAGQRHGPGRHPRPACRPAPPGARRRDRHPQQPRHGPGRGDLRQRDRAATAGRCRLRRAAGRDAGRRAGPGLAAAHQRRRRRRRGQPGSSPGSRPPPTTRAAWSCTPPRTAWTSYVLHLAARASPCAAWNSMSLRWNRCSSSSQASPSSRGDRPGRPHDPRRRAVAGVRRA